MIIVGAGMAGLIAANILKYHNPSVIDAQHCLPNNHKALLRFRSNKIASAVGIPFREVFVRKSIVHETNFLDKPNPYACNMYAVKVTGKVMDRSIWDITPGPRFIAPDNFIELLARGLRIKFDTRFILGKTAEPTISTIPMPIIMDLVGWKDKPQFEYHHIWTLNANIEHPACDVHQTLYFTDMSNPCYRASLVGNQLIAEFICQPQQPTEEVLREILDFFGIGGPSVVATGVKLHKQAYGKIVPIDDEVRKEFIYTLTREFNIYSLGRFATWRQLVLDDLVKDIELIDGLVRSEKRRRAYSQSLLSSQR